MAAAPDRFHIFMSVPYAQTTIPQLPAARLPTIWSWRSAARKRRPKHEVQRRPKHEVQRRPKHEVQRRPKHEVLCIYAHMHFDSTKIGVEKVGEKGTATRWGWRIKQTGWMSPSSAHHMSKYLHWSAAAIPTAALRTAAIWGGRCAPKIPPPMCGGEIWICLLKFNPCQKNYHHPSTISAPFQPHRFLVAWQAQGL